MNRTPLYLANDFIDWGMREGVEITQLKLQKLLYIFFARYLSTTGKRPFKDCPVKWPLGPVFPGVYQATKHFGAKPLTPLHDIEDGKIYFVTRTDDRFHAVFQETVRRYGQMQANDLVRLTHSEVLPNYTTAWSNPQINIGEFLTADDVARDGGKFFESR